ncbi:MAG TPA: hypothetical protein VIN59_09695, partial [Alphaproteobacteria bacterium]
VYYQYDTHVKAVPESERPFMSVYTTWGAPKMGFTKIYQILNIVPYGERFVQKDSGLGGNTCELTKNSTATELQKKITGCSVLFPASLANDQDRLNERDTLKKELQVYTYFKDDVMGGGTVHVPYDGTDTLNTRIYRSPYNLQLSDKGLDLWKMLVPNQAPNVDAVLFPYQFEVWQTVDVPGKFDAITAAEPVEIYRAQLPLSDAEQETYASQIGILRAMIVTQLVADQAELQKNISAYLSNPNNRLAERIDRIQEIFPVLAMASEWGLGECLYAEPLYEPIRYLNTVRIQTAEGPQNIAQFVGGLTTAKTSAEFAARFVQLKTLDDEWLKQYSSLPKTNVYIGPRDQDGKPYQELMYTSTSEEIDPSKFYATSAYCSLGEPAIVESLRIRDQFVPAGP